MPRAILFVRCDKQRLPIANYGNTLDFIVFINRRPVLGTFRVTLIRNRKLKNIATRRIAIHVFTQ